MIDLETDRFLRLSLMRDGATGSLQPINFPADRGRFQSWYWTSITGPIAFLRSVCSDLDWKDIHCPCCDARHRHGGKVIIANAYRLNTMA